MGIHEGTSNWLRQKTNMDNSIVHADMALNAARERKRIDKERKPLPLCAMRVPNGWEPLGKRRANGNIMECGKFLEIWVSAEKYHIGKGCDGQKLPAQGKTKEDDASVARRVNARARKQIRRVVNTNNFRAMHTLTIAPPSPANDLLYATIPYERQKDYDHVRALFKQFIQRLLRKLQVSSLPYLVVFELHDSVRTNPLKRGCWHAHLATDVGDSIKNAIAATWWHGRVDSQDFRYDKEGNERDTEICNPGAYMAEYIGKEGAQFGDAKLRNKKRYTTSRSVSRPVKTELDGSGISGDFALIEYKGKRYKNIYYKTITIPGSVLCQHTAHYVEVSP